MIKLIRPTVFFNIALFLSACGVQGPHKIISPSANDSAKLAGQISYEDVQPIFTARCTPCHEWNVKNKALEVATKMKVRLEGRTMPQPGSPQAAALTEGERGKLIAWVNGVLNAKQGTPEAAALPTTDVVRDRKLAFFYRCTACHGLRGESVSDAIPNLAGMGPDFFKSEITEFLKPGSQKTMPRVLSEILTEFKVEIPKTSRGNPVLKGELADLIDYVAQIYSQFSSPLSIEDRQSRRKTFDENQMNQYTTGRQLFSEKKLENEMLCVSCHLTKELKPLAMAPMVFGQKPQFLKSRLEDFKNGVAGNIMPEIAKQLSPQDIDALVLYLSNTHPGESAVKAAE